jgi:branched-chain amino acid transport system substrate-binding protein
VGGANPTSLADRGVEMRSRAVRLGTVVIAVCALLGASTAAGGASAPAKKASGEPVVFGMYNLEDSPLGSFTEMRLGSEAAMKYVNAELNGFHGRPGKLETCITKGSPETSTQCANQLLEKSPLAIIGGVDFLSLTALPIYEQANMPILGGAAITPPEQTSPVAVRFTGWPRAALPVQALYAAKNLRAKKVAIVFPEFPPARTAVEQYVKPVLQANGVTDITEATGSQTQSDWTPTFSAAQNSDPDAILSVSDPTQCLAMMQARQSLAIEAPLLMVADCSDSATLKNAGAAAEGVYFVYQSLPPTSSNKDVKTFLKAMKKYAPKGTPITEVTSLGFAQVMNIRAVLNAAPESILSDSSAVLSAFKATKDQPNFGAHPYTCDGQQVPGAVAVCDASARVIQVKNGKIVDVGKKWFNGAEDTG